MVVGKKCARLQSKNHKAKQVKSYSSENVLTPLATISCSILSNFGMVVLYPPDSVLWWYTFFCALSWFLRTRFSPSCEVLYLINLDHWSLDFLCGLLWLKEGVIFFLTNSLYSFFFLVLNCVATFLRAQLFTSSSTSCGRVKCSVIAFQRNCFSRLEINGIVGSSFLFFHSWMLIGTLSLTTTPHWFTNFLALALGRSGSSVFWLTYLML